MSDALFPESAVAVIAQHLDRLDNVSGVEQRPLRPTDPSASIGVYALTWAPEEALIGQFDPALERWIASVQGFVIHGDEEEGLREHGILARDIRQLLYRDPDFRHDFSSLFSDDGVTRERMQRWGIMQQRFVSNEVEGRQLYLSVTELWFETESVRL